MSEAIYGRFKGADLVNIAGLGDTWVLPCTTEVNMSFAFAGKNFTIHPLDSTVEPSTLSLSNVKTSTGEDGCFGTVGAVSQPRFCRELIVLISTSSNLSALQPRLDMI